MIEGPIKQGERFAHIRTGEHYLVLNGTSTGDLDHETLVKVTPEKEGVSCATAGWIKAVIYYDRNKPNMTFVRDEANFRQNFERRP